MELTESALLLEVPAAEGAVGRWRQHLDTAATLEVPAHITALFPFVPSASIDDDVLARVAAVTGSTEPFDLILDRTAWFGSEVLWLAPADPGPYRDLTSRLWAAFPDQPPYGGAHADVVLHLTVGSVGTQVPVAELRRAERHLSGSLPIHQRVDRLALWVGGGAPGSWRRVRELTFGS